MPYDFEKAIVRIYHQDGRVLGAGFLTNSNQIITCAHVVSACLGLEEISEEIPIGNIQLDFPLVTPDQLFTARTLEWHPLKDIALLEIVEELPQQAYVSSLYKIVDFLDHEFHVYGFPDGRDYGLWSFGRILGPNARGFVQIESETSHIVRQGFSGSLVWDSTSQQIVGIIVEADRNARETRTAYFLSVNSILESFPHLESMPLAQNENGVRYSCFISYPNDVGIQGQLVREFAEAIYDALSVELGGLLDKPIFFDREHINGDEGVARAICESVCFVMIFTPKYFNEKLPLCALEFKAMQELEAKRLQAIGTHIGDLSFIIPVRPYSRDVLPMQVIGQRRDYDFREMTIAGNLRAHPQYGPLVRKLAEHIFSCYQLMEGCNSEFGECSDFRLPSVDQVQNILLEASPHKFTKFPIR